MSGVTEGGLTKRAQQPRFLASLEQVLARGLIELPRHN
jgi:hypothetical protein